MIWELFNLQHMGKCGNFSVFIALAFYWFHCAKYSNQISNPIKFDDSAEFLAFTYRPFYLVLIFNRSSLPNKP